MSEPEYPDDDATRIVTPAPEPDEDDGATRIFGFDGTHRTHRRTARCCAPARNAPGPRSRRPTVRIGRAV